MKLFNGIKTSEDYNSSGIKKEKMYPALIHY